MTVHAQSGKYAPKHLQAMLNTNYVDANQIRLMPKQFTLFESTLLNRLTDSVRYFLNIYQSPQQKILLLTSLVDIAKEKYYIHDVLLAKNVSTLMEVKSVMCRKNKVNDPSIVAIAKSSDGAYFTKIVKAWKIDFVSKIFIGIPTTSIDCLNEGYEQY